MSERATPEFITFTGIDDRTDLGRANELAEQYPIEWGVLFSEKNRDARFPSEQAVTEILRIGGKKSAHLCGVLARRALDRYGTPERVDLGSFDRVQLNGVQDFEPSDYRYFCKAFGVDVILQWIRPYFPEDGPKRLFDCSGGRGRLPEQIPPHPGGDRLVGYAGGIGPDTVNDYLSRIGAGKFWIDMESRVRTNGWFDLSKVQAVCEAVYGARSHE